MEADRTENKNLASQYPEKVMELATAWQALTESASVVPKPPVMPTKPERAKDLRDCD